MSEQSERLRFARRKAGYRSATKAAERLGVKVSTYAAHENGQNGFDATDARQYGKLFQVTAAWLLTGEEDGGTANADTVRTLDDPPVSVNEMEIRGGSGSFGFEAFVEAAMQGGVSISGDRIKAGWGIPESYLRGDLHITRGGAVIVEVFGDSMYDPANPGAPGSLFPNDRVLIDVGDRRPTPPGPFLVWDGLGMVVKLVERSPSKKDCIRLSSRNPIYSSRDVSEDEARIIGRVRGRISAM